MDCTINAVRGTLQVGALQISYLEWPNNGTPILLLHGITSSAATFWRIGTDLAAAGHRVIALDMPGHGSSDSSTDHHMTTIAGIAGTAAEILGLERITVIGHSWGGATALALAAGAHPVAAQLSRVIAIDPLLSMNPTRGTNSLPNFLGGIAEPAEGLIPQLTTQNPTWHPCDVQWKAQALEQCRREQVAGLMLHSGDWTLLDQLAGIRADLLLLIADPQYTIIAADHVAALPRHVPPAAQIITIPGTTHNMLRGTGYVPTMAAIGGWLGLTMPVDHAD